MGNTALLNFRELTDQWRAIDTENLIALQADRPPLHSPAGGLERFRLGQPLINIAVELHKEGRCGHVVDLSLIHI